MGQGKGEKCVDRERSERMMTGSRCSFVDEGKLANVVVRSKVYLVSGLDHRAQFIDEPPFPRSVSLPLQSRGGQKEVERTRQRADIGAAVTILRQSAD